LASAKRLYFVILAKNMPMTANVIYTGDLRTEATHIRSGSSIETDAPVDNHGKGERFSPTDLVATALASCMVTTIGIAGAAHNLDIDGVVCLVEKIMLSDPRRIGEVRVTMDKKIIENTALTCPVLISLHPDCKKTLVINWV
jgi:putative redox protein